MRSHRLNDSGFTLIELIVVVVCVVLIPLVLFGIPWLMHYLWLEIAVAHYNKPDLGYWGWFAIMILMAWIFGLGQVRINIRRRG